MKCLVTIDPGVSSGIAIGEFSDTEPYKRTGFAQIGGGLVEFLKIYRRISHKDDITVVEKFIPLSGGGFSQTLKSVEPLRIEGALVALGVMPDYLQGKRNPQWQRPQAQYFAGGSKLPDKKKRARAWLKSHDLLLTGARDVGMKDADDANSALLHAFAYMRSIRHMPTLKHYFKDE